MVLCNKIAEGLDTRYIGMFLYGPISVVGYKAEN